MSWHFIQLCHSCEDTGRVAANRDSRGSAPCPVCGTTERRGHLWSQRNHDSMPTLHRSDLTAEEEKIVKGWREMDYHELDCLRWTEGRRYDPAKDEAFLAEARREFRAWRFLKETSKTS